ncbi:hypothetical protein CHCC20491_1849 [Bacillus paralicheniformis]|nr:hypothetical protein CHCC20491_1849 [Bacillus paralicheniformis]
MGMPKYKIYYGVGGTINDITKDNEAYEYENYQEALNIARQQACEAFESYERMCGVTSIEERIEQDGLTEEEAAAEYNEDVESWIEYGADEVE